MDDAKKALYTATTTIPEMHEKRIRSAEEWAHEASSSQLILAITGADGRIRGLMTPYIHRASCAELDLRIPRRRP